MKIEYGRNLQTSFMRILLEGELPKTEEAMLSKNNIEGLLETIWQKEDRGYVLRYNITGRQALDVMLETVMVDERLLSNLIQEVCLLCRRLEKYLLAPDGLMLEPEMIYWDTRKENFCFCYYPGETGVFHDKFIHLMEYLLTKTDHRNTRAVEIVYGVYETLMKEGNGLNEVQQNLEKIRKSWKVVKEIDKKEEIIDTIKEVSITENIKRRYITDIVKKLLERIKNVLNIGTKLKLHNNLKKKEQFIFEPEEEPEKLTNPTVLLSTNKQEIQGILKYEGSSSLRDIYISKIPFSIGSGEGCDGIIDDVTISRKHALITKADEIYFIEDMNSSNGTKIEEEFITYKTKISLKKNDVVQFANQRYRFI